MSDRPACRERHAGNLLQLPMRRALDPEPMKRGKYGSMHAMRNVLGAVHGKGGMRGTCGGV